MVKIFKKTEGNIIHNEIVIEASKFVSIPQDVADLLIRLYPDELIVETPSAIPAPIEAETPIEAPVEQSKTKKN